MMDGTWYERTPTKPTAGGPFVRATTSFRDWVSAAPSAPHPAEAGRYHLYVSLACPWAHRTLIFRALKKLEDVISVSIVEPLMLANGWVFTDRYPDLLAGRQYLYEVYRDARSDYTGRCSVPVLWDEKLATIVSNESSEIIRMFNDEFRAFTDVDHDYYPEELRSEIDDVNSLVFDTLNNGVYKAGFARTQEAYDMAARAVFATLDRLEQRLELQPYVCGDRLTEADWRLFTTLVRFDVVYYTHFKCNLRRIVDYPRLLDLMRRLHELPGVADTIDIDHIKLHYYGSHASVNPLRIVPKGPATWLG